MFGLTAINYAEPVILRTAREQLLVIRRATSGDLPLLTAFLAQFSTDTWYARYFVPRPQDTNALHQEAQRLIGIFATYMLGAQLPSLTLMVVLLVIGMACLGIGNGAIFQLVPQRFADHIGIATGVVGAIGGLGGFFLPNVLGTAKQISGSFSLGFAALGLLALIAFAVLQVLTKLRQGWRWSWHMPTLPQPAE